MWRFIPSHSPTLSHSREHEIWLLGFTLGPHLRKPLPYRKPKARVAIICYKEFSLYFIFLGMDDWNGLKSIVMMWPRIDQVLLFIFLFSNDERYFFGGDPLILHCGSWRSFSWCMRTWKNWQFLCKPSLKLYTGRWCTRPLERFHYTFKGFTLPQSQLSWMKDLNLIWRNSSMEILMEDGDNCRLVCYLSRLPSTQLKGLLIKLQTIPILKITSSPPCFIVEL